MDCKVSVIIPTYNRADCLSRAIESVVAQSYKDWELWVVDDGSTDSTDKVLRLYSEHPQVHVLKTLNHGVSAARNKAIELCRSQYICFLDSDDEWLPEKLKLQTDFMKDNQDCVLLHGEEVWVRNGVRVNSMKKHKKSGGDIFHNSLKLCCISPSTVMVRRSLFDEVGMFREDFPVCEDYDLWLKITSQYEVGFLSSDLIIKYGGHEDQLSRKYKAMDYWRVKSIHDLLLNAQLTDSKRVLALQEMRKKASVLLRGYRKHENLNNYDEVFCLHYD